jgi:hypothetical protein
MNGKVGYECDGPEIEKCTKLTTPKPKFQLFTISSEKFEKSMEGLKKTLDEIKLGESAMCNLGMDLASGPDQTVMGRFRRIYPEMGKPVFFDASIPTLPKPLYPAPQFRPDAKMLEDWARVIKTMKDFGIEVKLHTSNPERMRNWFKQSSAALIQPTPEDLLSLLPPSRFPFDGKAFEVLKLRPPTARCLMCKSIECEHVETLKKTSKNDIERHFHSRFRGTCWCHTDCAFLRLAPGPYVVIK